MRSSPFELKNCSARTVYETELKNAFVSALNKLVSDSDSYIPVLQSNIASVLTSMNPESAESIQARIDALQQEIIDKASRQEDYDAEAQEVLSLRAQKENSMLNDSARSEMLGRIRELQTFIAAQSNEITEFDESLVRHLLAKVTVFDQKLVFEFRYEDEKNQVKYKEIACEPHLKLIRRDSNLRIYFYWADKDVGNDEKVLVGRIGSHPY